MQEQAKEIYLSQKLADTLSPSSDYEGGHPIEESTPSPSYEIVLFLGEK